jgi:hypothetical protein
MVKWVALKKTTLLDDSIKLPRPKMTQEVLLIGGREECFEVINQMAEKPENWSTDIIDVDLCVVRYTGQISYNSKSIHKDNGKRDIGR